MSEWQEAMLGDYINIKHGYAFSGQGITKVETDDVLVTPGNFYIGGGFKSDKFKYFIGEYPESYILSEDDLVVTMTDLSKEGDTLGYGAKIPNGNGKRYLHNQRIGLVQVLSNEINKEYLYWVLRTKEYQGYILGAATGTSVRHTSPTTIKQYKFTKPELEEQKSIASVLSSLDDKIDLLNRQNKTLEDMAETLFRQWFVEEYEEGWGEYKVSDFAKHLKNSISPAKNQEIAFHHYSLPAFDDGMKPVIEFGAEILSNKYKIEPWTILVSKLNPRFPRIWPIGNQVDENAICSTEFQVFKPKNENLFGYLYFLFRSNDAREELTMSASGTSGSHQRVRPEDILNIRTGLPSIKMAENFSSMVMPGIKKSMENLKQIQLLEKMRDGLLPKLMSGDVRVSSDG